MRKKQLLILAVSLLIILFIGVAAAAAFWVWEEPANTAQPEQFDGERAYQDVLTQVDFGPRLPASTAHAQTIEWIKSSLTSAGWQVEVQDSAIQGQIAKNIVARYGTGEPLLLIGAHYDTRIYADQDPDPMQRTQPVPGANDGASGVGVLMEMGRVLPVRLDLLQEQPGQVWLVFFDAEDNGRIPGWEWIMGSTAFIERLTLRPDATVIVDMIGDADLNIYWEKHSDPELNAEIWQIAEQLGYGDVFIPEYRYSITDDHIPFLNAGLPAVDIIDFDYPFWHTVSDTPDKVSAASLQAVGDTLVVWIEQRLSLAEAENP
jgi:glutaminyl-peptide cyclotransferase